MENFRDQIKDLEINNLRCLNNYLCQTIDLLSQKYGTVGQGLSHTPYYGAPWTPYPYMGSNVFPPGSEASWTGGGISHSPVSVPQTPFGMPTTPVYPPTYPYYVDWFNGMPRTGLSHTPSPVMPGWQPQPWPNYAIEQVRQQQLAQAMAARQGFEAFCRGMYG